MRRQGWNSGSRVRVAGTRMVVAPSTATMESVAPISRKAGPVPETGSAKTVSRTKAWATETAPVSAAPEAATMKTSAVEPATAAAVEAHRLDPRRRRRRGPGRKADSSEGRH